MSENKQDKGKLYHKLHQLQKRVTRWLSNGSTDKLIFYRNEIKHDTGPVF